MLPPRYRGKENNQRRNFKLKAGIIDNFVVVVIAIVYISYQGIVFYSKYIAQLLIIFLVIRTQSALSYPVFVSNFTVIALNQMTTITL